MAKKKPKSRDGLIDLIVSFANVNIGDGSARIGITTARARDTDSLSLAVADKNLCERRLTGCIIVKENGDHPEQGTLGGMEPEEIELESIFEVKSITFKKDHIGFGLNFSLGDIDVGQLAKFAKRTGRLIILEVGDIPEMDRKTAASGEKDDDDE